MNNFNESKELNNKFGKRKLISNENDKNYFQQKMFKSEEKVARSIIPNQKLFKAFKNLNLFIKGHNELVESYHNKLLEFKFIEEINEFINLDLRILAYYFISGFTKILYRLDSCDFKLFITEKMIQTYEQILNFYNSENSRIVYLNGMVGIGKTSVLFYTVLKFKKMENIKVIYYNFAQLFNPICDFHYFMASEIFYTFVSEIETNSNIY